MNYKMIKYFFGIMLMLEATFMLIPTATALIYSEDITPFIITIGILLSSVYHRLHSSRIIRVYTPKKALYVLPQPGY